MIDHNYKYKKWFWDKFHKIINCWWTSRHDALVRKEINFSLFSFFILLLLLITYMLFLWIILLFPLLSDCGTVGKFTLYNVVRGRGWISFTHYFLIFVNTNLSHIQDTYMVCLGKARGGNKCFFEDIEQVHHKIESH